MRRQGSRNRRGQRRQSRGSDLATKLSKFVALGFKTFNLVPVGAPAVEQIGLLATEVLPSVRAMA